MSNRSNAGLTLWLVASLMVAGCSGSSASTESSTTRLTVLPETTTPAFEPTESTRGSGVTEPSNPVDTTAGVTTTTWAPNVATTVIDGAATTIAAGSTTTADTTVTSTEEDPRVNSTTSDVAGPSAAELTLTTDGIGGAKFGAEPDGIITYISTYLGAPTGDTGYVEPITIGACSGNEVRLVTWTTLTLTFGDVSRVVQGQRHFYAYSFGVEGQPAAAPLGLATESGITVGSPLADVLVAFPNAVLNPADEFTPPNFYVNDDFRGYVTGLADDSTVSVIFGGLGCGE